MANYDPPLITGGCIGVDIVDRGSNDKHKMVVVCIEDDDAWHRKIDVSSFWLDEMIAKLIEAKEYLDNNHERYKWGYREKGYDTGETS